MWQLGRRFPGDKIGSFGSHRPDRWPMRRPLARAMLTIEL
jgi:hypothetical protein